MVLGPDTKLKDFLAAYPFMKEFLIGFNPHFKALDNPLLWKTVGRFATLSKAAVMGGAKLPDLLAALAGEIERRTGTRPGVQGEGQPAATREQTLKGIIRDLHANEDVGAAKERFRELIKDVAPWEIGKMEQTLIKEGLPESEVKRLCSVHVEVFKESLDQKAVPGLPAGHPVHTLMRENREAERIARRARGDRRPEGRRRARRRAARAPRRDRHALPAQGEPALPGARGQGRLGAEQGDVGGPRRHPHPAQGRARRRRRRHDHRGSPEVPRDPGARHGLQGGAHPLPDGARAAQRGGVGEGRGRARARSASRGVSRRSSPGGRPGRGRPPSTWRATPGASASTPAR